MAERERRQGKEEIMTEGEGQSKGEAEEGGMDHGP